MKKSLCSIVLSIGGLQLALAQHPVDYHFTLPPNYWLSIQITFHSGWEENIVLLRESGQSAVMQANNYSQGTPITQNPVGWGPWRDQNPSVPLSLVLVSKHKEGSPNTGLPWKETWMHVVQPLTTSPDGRTMYATVQWGDNSANDAVTASIAMSPVKELAKPQQ